MNVRRKQNALKQAKDEIELDRGHKRKRGKVQDNRHVNCDLVLLFQINIFILVYEF